MQTRSTDPHRPEVTRSGYHVWAERDECDRVLRVLRGETLDALGRKLGVSPGRLAEWRDEAIAAMQAAP